MIPLEILGAIALSICLFALVMLHILPTGLPPLKSFVSTYALTQYGKLYGIQAFSSGITAVILTYIIVTQNILHSSWGLIGLASYALSRLIIPFFVTDSQGNSTIHGKIHIVLAFISFYGIAVGITHIHFSDVPHDENMLISLFSTVTVVSALGLIFFNRLRPLKKFQGLIERGIYLGALGWMGTSLVYLIWK